MKRTALIVVAAAAIGSGCTTYFETPTSPITTSPPDPNTFSGALARGGSASRTLTMGTAGSIEATLTDMSPSVPIGLGVGIPRSDQGGCNVTRSVETMAGSSPQLTIPADAGTYCVKVFDMGHIQEEVSFTVRIAHP